MSTVAKPPPAERLLTDGGPARTKPPATGHNGVEQLARNARRFGLVLLELAPPPHSGLEALVRFHQAHPETPVLVVSALDDEEHILAAFAAGATGYIRKEAAPAVVAAAMELCAARGQPTLQQTPGASAADPPTGRARSVSRTHSGSLSKRQVEVLHLAAQGLTNKDIAHTLRLAENTIKVHLRTAYARLGVSSRVQAVLAAARVGIELR